MSTILKLEITQSTIYIHIVFLRIKVSKFVFFQKKRLIYNYNNYFNYTYYFQNSLKIQKRNFESNYMYTFHN